MSVFVQIGEKDNAFDLASTLDKIAERPEPEENVDVADMTGLTGMVHRAEYMKLVKTGVLDSLSTILACSDEVVQLVFTLTFAQFNRLSAAEVVTVSDAIVRALGDVNYGTVSLNARLRILTQLLNLLVAPPISSTPRRETPVDAAARALLAVLAITLRTDQAAIIAQSFPTIVSLASQWNLSPQVYTQILRSIYLVALRNGPEKADEHLYAYLKSIDKVAENCESSVFQSVLSASHSDAVTAALRAVTTPLSLTNPQSVNPLTPQRLLPLAALGSLSTSTTESDLLTYQLLQLFAHDDISGYLRFYTSHRAWCDSTGLDHEANLRKLRTLALCTIASTTGTMSIEQCQQHLLLDDPSAVDNAVIDAIISGRLDARIDQLSNTVQVRRVVGSIMKPTGTKNKWGGELVNADWKALSNKLNGWKMNVSVVLQQLQGQVREDEEATVVVEDI